MDPGNDAGHGENALSALRRFVVVGRILVALLALLALAPCLALHENVGEIKVLLTGRVSEGHLIHTWFLNEPLVDPLFVPSRDVPGGDDQIRRFVRVYFPRTYEGVQVQDFIIIDGTIINMFTVTNQKWMHDAILDGSGGLNSRSLLSGIYYPEWSVSVTQKAFPNDVEALMAKAKDIFRSDRELDIILEENPGLPPVLTMFKDKNIQWHLTGYSCGHVIPRQGAIVWAWIKGPFADEATVKAGCTPHTISWTYGQGKTWTIHDRLVNWWEDPVANPYGLDMIMNMILYSTGRHLPDDVEIVHEIRSRIIEYRTRQVMILAVVDFAESFGANMQSILKRMGEVTEKTKLARDQYLSQDYLVARATYLDAISDLGDLNALAMKKKDQAMVWVYLVQWFTVSGTSMLAGSLLWMLMVRRRLYRQVRVTRLIQR